VSGQAIMDRFMARKLYQEDARHDFVPQYVGSNIMKTTLYILTILLNRQIFAETKKGEDFGFRHVQTIYQGETSLYFGGSINE
jgi:hypothetical protein